MSYTISTQPEISRSLKIHSSHILNQTPKNPQLSVSWFCLHPVFLGVGPPEPTSFQKSPEPWPRSRPPPASSELKRRPTLRSVAGPQGLGLGRWRPWSYGSFVVVLNGTSLKSCKLALSRAKRWFGGQKSSEPIGKKEQTRRPSVFKLLRHSKQARQCARHGRSCCFVWHTSVETGKTKV